MKFNRCFGETYHLYLQCRRIQRETGSKNSWFMLDSCLVYSLTLKKEGDIFMSAEFQRTTRRYNPEDRTLYSHRWLNFKSNFLIFLIIFTNGMVSY
jgi:hypothetical protein